MTNISLLDKEKCSIAVLESTISYQEMLVDSFLDLGYKNLFPFSDIDTLVREIQIQDYDWCLLSLEHMPHINLTEFIDNIYKISKNQSLIISVIHKENEKDNFLLSLFERGIISAFSRPDSLETFQDQILSFLNRVEFNKGNYVFVSGEKIRSILKKNQFNRSLLQFEKALLDLYPGAVNCLLNLAEAQCLNKNYSAAKTTLSQAEYIDSNIKSVILDLEKKYPVKENTESEKKNILAIDNCVIIDPDTDVQYYVTETLSKLGINNCLCISDGQAAYNYFKQSKEPNLILMEWKLPTLQGISLIQRIRKLGFEQCLIIIMSSLVKVADKPLLQEVGVDAIIEKPFDALKLSKELIGVVQRWRKPLEQSSLERKIRAGLALNKLEEVEVLLKEFDNHPLISKASKLMMHAEYEYERKNYALACNNALNSLKEAGQSVLLLSLLGKCFLQLKDYKNSTRCFEMAHELSPSNVDRILALVDLKQGAGNNREAKELLDSAKKIDATRTDVVEMEVRIALNNSDIDTASNLLKTLDSLTGIVGMINNDAVAKIRAGKFDDGIKLYNEALQSLPIESVEIRELITYNYALAYARYGDLEKCMEVLKSIKILPNSKIYQKFSSFKTRVRYSIMHKTPLELRDSSEKSMESNEERTSQYGNLFDSVTKINEIKKGSRCCFKIYFRIEKGEL